MSALQAECPISVCCSCAVFSIFMFSSELCCLFQHKSVSETALPGPGLVVGSEVCQIAPALKKFVHYFVPVYRCLINKRLQSSVKCRKHTCFTPETPIMAFLNVHPGGSAFSEGGGAICRPVTLGSSSTAQHLVNSWCRDYIYCQAFTAPGVGGGVEAGVGGWGCRSVTEGVMKSLSVDVGCL